MVLTKILFLWIPGVQMHAEQEDGCRWATHLPWSGRNSLLGPKSSCSFLCTSACCRSRSASALWCSQYLSFTACPSDMCSAGPKGVAFRIDSTAVLIRPNRLGGPAIHRCSACQVFVQLETAHSVAPASQLHTQLALCLNWASKLQRRGGCQIDHVVYMVGSLPDTPQGLAGHDGLWVTDRG